MVIPLSQLDQHPKLLISMLSIITIFSFFFFFFFFNSIIRRRNPSVKSPPSPKELPLLGNLHQLGRLPHRTLFELSKQHGPLMLLHFGRVPVLVVSSAEFAHEILRTHDLAFASRPPSSIAKKLLYDAKDVSFSPYGEYWRQARRVLVVHLLRLERVQSFRPVRDEEVALMLGKVRASSVDGPVNLSETIIAMANNVVCRVAFGRTYFQEKGGDVMKAMLAELVELLGQFPVGDYVPWLAWFDRLNGLTKRADDLFRELDAFLDELIRDCGASRGVGDDGRTEEKENLVHVLLSLEKTEKTGMQLSRDSIKALILDVFAGGTDTIFTATNWTMAELVRHPEEMMRIREEIRSVVGVKEKIEDEDLEQLKYLKAVIKESLRLHPPEALVLRECNRDVELKGYDIPVRTRVAINTWAIGRDPTTWEKPEEFWPKRFMNSAIDYTGKDFQFIPFGSGRRGCPGISFAIPVIEHAVAHLVHHFDWNLHPGMSSNHLDLDETYGITVHLKSSLMLVAKPLFP